MTAREVAFSLGALSAPVLVIFIGWLVQRQMNLGRDLENQVKWPLGAAVVLALILLISTCSRSNSDSAPKVEEVVEVIDGDREEPLPNSMTQEEVTRFQDGMTEAIYASGFGGQLGTSTATTVAERFGGKTVLRYEAKGSTGILLIQYVGVINKQRKTVSCVSTAGKSFAGCRNKAIELFGAPEPSSQGAKANG